MDAGDSVHLHHLPVLFSIIGDFTILATDFALSLKLWYLGFALYTSTFYAKCYTAVHYLCVVRIGYK